MPKTNISDKKKNIHRVVANLCLKHFNSLPKSGKPQKNEWTVLSCIVKEQENHFQVVALGTGTKCVGKSKLCPKGTILNDSHAEVICRRAFLRYIYSELNKDSSIFSFNEGPQSAFVLKPNVYFHFFTTHTPCGDAAIFLKQNTEEFGEIINLKEVNTDSVPAKRGKFDIEEDIFRTGAKCLSRCEKQDVKGKGVQYHTLGVVRTKPGRGDPTISVSCSDKISKWCHLGLQGALLMTFLEKPLYLSSFTIVKNTPFCEEALKRALYNRLASLHLEEPFEQRILYTDQVDSSFIFIKNNGKRSCSSSISWYLMQGKNDCLEVAVNGRKQGVTKKNVNSEKARLKICKLELFRAFISKLEELNIKLHNEIENKDLTYHMAKNSNKEYKFNWNALKRAFGVWTLKDISLSEFKL